MRRQRWVASAFGSFDRLSLVQDALHDYDDEEDLTDAGHQESLADGCVRARVRYAGLNFADVFTVLGLYSAAPAPPITPGLEFSGVIITSRSAAFKPGDAVYGVTRFGGLATIIDSDARYIRLLPAGWTLQEGASFSVQAVTAYYGLSILGNVTSGSSTIADKSQNLNLHNGSEPLRPKTVLVHSAAGGVGLWALELCRVWGCRVLGTVGSGQTDKLLMLQDRYANEIRNNGWQFVKRRSASGFQVDVENFISMCDHGMNSSRSSAVSNTTTLDNNSKPAFSQASDRDHKKNSPKGFDVVLDSLLGDYFNIGYRGLTPQGRLIVLGAGSMAPQGPLVWYNVTGWLSLIYRYLSRPRVDPLLMIADNKAVMGFNLIWLWDEVDMLAYCLSELERMVASMHRPTVGRIFAWNDVPKALEWFQRGHNIGKVLVEVPDE